MNVNHTINKGIVLFCFTYSLSACSDSKQVSVNLELIEFDVTKKYPVKELDIHDLAKVNYVVFETDAEYLFYPPDNTMIKDFIITKNFIIKENFREQSILFFDKNGKPVSKVSRRGDGPEEYIRADNYLYIEEEDNLYLASLIGGSSQKIKVYDRKGNFKREYSTPENIWIDGMYNFDDDNLLLHFDEQHTPYALLSKQDGNVTLLPDLYIEEPRQMVLEYRNLPWKDGIILYSGFFYFQGEYAVKNVDDLLLTEYSSDTIYRLTPDKQLSPAFVRKPSTEMTDPKIAVHCYIETSDYLFFSSVRREVDMENFIPHPKTGHLIDRKDRQIYNQHIINKDYEGMNVIIDPYSVNTFITPNVGIIYYYIDELEQANEKGKLKGKLKEAFERMTDDDEFIAMVFELK